MSRHEGISLEDAAGLLRSGGVLVMGTDTLPGLHCRADHEEAVDRIVAMKGRAAGHSFGVLAGSFEQADLVTGYLEERVAAYCRKCWPGPFSLILPAGGSLCGKVASVSGTVAVRVPAVPSLRALLLEVGFPVVSTSANLTGQPPIAHLEAAATAFSLYIDGTWQPEEIEENTKNEEASLPSCLINLAVWPPEILRKGPLEAPAAD